MWLFPGWNCMSRRRKKHPEDTKTSELLRSAVMRFEHCFNASLSIESHMEKQLNQGEGGGADDLARS